MIELLLEAERALSFGMLDQADRLYRQAADADPRNSIAVVGLARVAIERGDEEEALRQGERALEIDGENQAARRLVARLREVREYREAAARAAPRDAARAPELPRSTARSTAPGMPRDASPPAADPLPPDAPERPRDVPVPVADGQAPVTPPDPPPAAPHAEDPPWAGFLRRLFGRR